MEYLYWSIVGILFILIGTQVYAGFRAAPWVPTKGGDVKRFLELAGVKKGQKVYDLGCGDGRLVLAAAKMGALAYGYEISLLPYLLAKFKTFDFAKAHIFYKDFWGVNLKDADVVYFFLMPKVYKKLQKKFEKELKKGAKVIAYVWPIADWKPKRVDTVSGRAKVYLYEKS